METYYWKTLDYHHDNSFTMDDYLRFHLPGNTEVIMIDGSYAEIKYMDKKYALHASGNGDSYNHKVEFEEL